jgi:hypothetical protein
MGLGSSKKDMPRQDVPPGNTAGVEPVTRAINSSDRKHSRDSLLLERLQDYNRETELSIDEQANIGSIFFQYADQYSDDGGISWKDVDKANTTCAPTFYVKGETEEPKPSLLDMVLWGFGIAAFLFWLSCKLFDIHIST